MCYVESWLCCIQLQEVWMEEQEYIFVIPFLQWTADFRQEYFVTSVYALFKLKKKKYKFGIIN